MTDVREKPLEDRLTDFAKRWWIVLAAALTYGLTLAHAMPGRLGCGILGVLVGISGTRIWYRRG